MTTTAVTTKCPTWSPWGKIDHRQKRANGIYFVTTASHGGIWVAPERRGEMPEAFRKDSGWYEEDCEWSLAVLSFPDEFSPELVEEARRTAKVWYPDEYMAATGEVLTTEDSFILKERELRVQHANDYVVVSAVGVGDGMVEVFAVRGGRTENYQFASNDKAYFLVPSEEYSTRSSFGFIVDEARHQRLDRAIN